MDDNLSSSGDCPPPIKRRAIIVINNDDANEVVQDVNNIQYGDEEGRHTRIRPTITTTTSCAFHPHGMFYVPDIVDNILSRVQDASVIRSMSLLLHPLASKLIRRSVKSNYRSRTMHGHGTTLHHQVH